MTGGGPAADLRDIALRLGPLVVVESRRTRPVPRVAFAHATIFQIMAGTLKVIVPGGRRTLGPGDLMVLGKAMPFEAEPAPEARIWTISVEEEFLRSYMFWVLPDIDSLRVGLSSGEWDGGAICVHLGRTTPKLLEPLLRRMSVLPHRDDAAAAAKLLALFAKVVELLVPHVVADPTRPRPVRSATKVGRLASRPVSGESERIAGMLRSDLARPWTVAEIAREVSLSRSQLTRRFQEDFGISPMRWLMEARTTEFARLIEETTISVAEAAQRVGWVDRRIAAAWFRRRYGVSPTQFRR